MAKNLQDGFLNTVKKERIPVAIFLSKGVQLKGIVKGYDNFTIFLEDSEKKVQMVYKHSVTTVSPLKDMSEKFLHEFFHNLNADK